MGVLVLCLTTCKKDIAPRNPCDTEQVVTADFVVEELIGNRWFQGDTIACCNKVRLQALQEADEYVWIVGQDTFHEKIVYDSNFPFGWLDVTLVIKRKPNTLCFPDDDGLDTKHRKIYVWPRNNDGTGTPPKYPDYPLYGTYYGYNLSNPNSYFHVTIYDTFWRNNQYIPAYVGLVSGVPFKESEWNKYVLDNADLKYFTLNDDRRTTALSPKAIRLLLSSGMGRPTNSPLTKEMPVFEGYAWLNRSDINQIVFEYAYGDLNNLNDFYKLKFKDKFIGRRIK